MTNSVNLENEAISLERNGKRLECVIKIKIKNNKKRYRKKKREWCHCENVNNGIMSHLRMSSDESHCRNWKFLKMLH